MPSDAPNGRRAWIVTGLLFLFAMINFIDKLVAGLAGVPIMREFHLHPGQYGALSGSFYALYAISGLVVGLFIVQRASPKWLLVCLVVIWTVSQVPMVFGASLLALYVGRVMLGVGEGPATPTAYHAIYGWFTSERRNMPTAVLLAGIGTGFLIGSPILAHVMAAYGWRAGFVLCGVIGVVWLVAWSVFGADGPLVEIHGTHSTTGSRVPWGRFWADRTVVANLAMATACYWLTGVSIIWLAPYLEVGLGYSPRATGWLMSVILGSQVVVQVGLAFLSHRMLASGRSSRTSRGLVVGGAVFVAGIALALATIVHQPIAQVLLLTAAFTLPQLCFVIGPAIVAEVAPAAQRGTALLVTYSIITVAGLASPIITGRIVGAAGAAHLLGYNHAFWLTAAIVVVGGIWALLGLNPEATRSRFARSGAPALANAEPAQQPVT